jgi:hypothetical protein
MKKHTAKRDGIGLDFKTFTGKSKKSYIIFRTPKGSFHAFAEVDAKEAAVDCGAPDGNTRAQWKAVWDAYQQVKKSQPVIPKPEPRKGPSLLETIRARKTKASS